MDFTINTYTSLLKTLQSQGYTFQSFAEFLQNPAERSIILRNDVDRLPENALRFAKIQAGMGITASYFFRIAAESYHSGIIKKIVELGHEIGYHYEDLHLCKGDIDKAFESFSNNLAQLRQYYPVKTICMHGSPRSKWDSMDIWEKYDYRSLGIIGEPYFDIDFDEVFYLTDTGRRWDGWKVSVRDKVPQQEKRVRQGLVFHSTNDIIKAAQAGFLPNQIMITTHPQRWTDKPVAWVKEWVLQNLKNIVKRILVAIEK